MLDDSIRRILFATDGSADALEAAEFSARLASALKAGVTLLHVAPNAGLPLGTTQLGAESPSLGPEDEVTVVKTVWEGAQVILDHSAEPFDRLGILVEGLVQEGEPEEEILRLAADHSFDLLVLGKRGMGGSESDLGNTASAVIRRAPCPVLVVGSKG